MTTRLLGFNTSSGEFDYITSDSTGSLNVALPGDIGSLIKGSYSGASVEVQVSSAGKVETIANGYDYVNGAHRALKCDENGLLTVQVGNATGTQLDVKSSNATPVFARGLSTSTVQVATSATVSGPQQIGTIAVDTDGYAWIAAFISCPSGVSSGGQIYLQYSPDNNNWGQSYDSVFINTSGSATVGLIRLSSPVPFRYVRIWAESGFSATGVNAYIAMK